MVVLIACCAKKKDGRCKAEELYQGALFKKSLAYARKINADKIYILSAKNHLVDLDEECDPYNLTLNDMPAKERKIWAEEVLKQMKEKGINFSEETMFLCGQRYRENLIKNFPNVQTPLEHLKIGEQLHKLTQLLED